MSPLRPHVTLLVASSLLLVLMAAARANGACNATCKRDIARCMATQCEGMSGVACRRRCKPAAIRTLAYVQSECRVDASGSLVGRQSLRIRRGDREPVTAVEFASSEPVPDPLGFCAGYRSTGFGGESVLAFALQRLGVSPDGSGVVFEVNDEAPFFRFMSLPPAANGIFFVRSDGSGLRSLGPPSSDPSFRVGPEFGLPPYLPVDLNLAFTFSPPIAFSPDGRRIAFTDLGPGPGGEEAVQIVVLDLATANRTPVTRLPSGTAPRPIPEFLDASPYFLTSAPRFVDDETLVFQTFTDPDGHNPKHEFAAYTVRIDGSGLKRIANAVLQTGSQVIPSFGIAGRGTNLVRISTSDTPIGPPVRPPADFPVSEVFVQEGDNLLQLTRLYHVDTFPGFVSVGRTRAFFLSSADPLGTNRHGNCQIFSIDTLASPMSMRQVTHFDVGDLTRVILGCACQNCGIGYGYYKVIFQDPVTQAIVFSAAHDPLRLGQPFPDDQVFAIRPDGGGLRQLTDAAGATRGPDGLRVEFTGPLAYSVPIR
jgi:hypothetical protein